MFSFLAFAKTSAAPAAETPVEDPSHGTIIPEPSEQFKNASDCQKLMLAVNTDILTARDAVAKREAFGTYNAPYTDILACGIVTGAIQLWMIPFYIRFVLEFIIGLAGLIAVGGIVYGGYLYLFAGISDDKDKGKNAIKNGLIGLVLTLTAWAIVNIVISVVTA